MIDDLPVEDCAAFEAELYRFIEISHPAIFETIRTKKNLDDQLRKDLTAAIKEFKDRFVAARNASAPVAAHA
jgi:F-type H+-transporting ATPase subunit alpha